MARLRGGRSSRHDEPPPERWRSALRRAGSNRWYPMRILPRQIIARRGWVQPLSIKGSVISSVPFKCNSIKDSDYGSDITLILYRKCLPRIGHGRKAVCPTNCPAKWSNPNLLLINLDADLDHFNL